MSSAHSVTITPFYCAFFFWCLFGVTNAKTLIIHRECVPSTIEVMYLSFRRSKDALLALGFFVLMVVVVFSTLLYVLTFSSRSLTRVDHIKVLY